MLFVLFMVKKNDDITTFYELVKDMGPKGFFEMACQYIPAVERHTPPWP
jgi:hypothetical protein